VITESDEYNAAFPARRIAHVALVLKDGRRLVSGPTEARFDPESPVGDAAVREKFHRLAVPAIGRDAAAGIERVTSELGSNADLTKLLPLLTHDAGADVRSRVDA